jgi:beta-lactamase regulating signal transducer with metallopeptidase domain
MVSLLRGFLTFERQLGSEQVSLWILLFASAGFVGWSESLIRGFGALWHSLRWNYASVLETPELFLAVAGFWRPRIIASRGFLETIPAPERSIALRHELAHFESRDNWKRLFLLLTPRPIPFFRFGFRQLESAWMRFAERAADDAAVAGDPSRAVLLAEILVRTARSRCGAASPFLASALIGSPGELGARVERLLNESAAESQRCEWPSYLSTALVLIPCFVAVFLPAKPLFEVAERFLLHL